MTIKVTVGRGDRFFTRLEKWKAREWSPLKSPKRVGLIGPIHVSQRSGIAIKVVFSLFVVMLNNFEGVHSRKDSTRQSLA